MTKDRILIVDDDPDNRAMVGHFLGNWGYEVDYADNGKLALEKVEVEAPQLVLLDLEMPEMDGFETCERLKSNPDTEWIPVVIFTGLEKLPHRLRGFRDGADDYIVKSAQPEELKSRIELVLSRTQKYSKLQQPPTSEQEELVLDADDVLPPEGEERAGSEDTPAPTPFALEKTTFAEAIQQILAQRDDGSAHVTNGERTGVVHFASGRIIHATTDGESGEEAFYALALWKSGELETKDAEPDVITSIETPTRGLLVEASRRSDAWRMISSKVPSFDLVPRCVPLSGAPSIRLTKSDWAVMRLADGTRSIAEIVDEIQTDIFEAGRVVFSLITIGVLRLDDVSASADEAFRMLPTRGDTIDVDEPFELTSLEWETLSRVDGKSTLRSVRDTMDMDSNTFLETIRGLEDKGFLRLTAPQPTTEEI